MLLRTHDAGEVKTNVNSAARAYLIIVRRVLVRHAATPVKTAHLITRESRSRWRRSFKSTARWRERWSRKRHLGGGDTSVAPSKQLNLQQSYSSRCLSSRHATWPARQHQRDSKLTKGRSAIMLQFHVNWSAN